MRPKPRHPVVVEYLSDRLARCEIGPTSAQVIGPVLGQWLRHVDHRPPREWTVDQVASWVNRSDLRPSTRKSRLTKLRPFVAWLIRRGHLATDPTLDIGRIRVPKGAPRDLTRDEVGALLAACPDERAELLVLLMVQLGLRAGDAARILIEDIDIPGRRLHVRAKGGGGDHTHWAPIPTQAWEALTASLHRHGRRSGPLFTSTRRLAPVGLQPATVSKLVGRWMRDAGVKQFPYDGRSSHSLRHTCAQDMIDAGAEPRQVQHALGHHSLSTTEKHYLLREPPGLRAAMEGRSYRPAA